jgi:hypothetical protein
MSNEYQWKLEAWVHLMVRVCDSWEGGCDTGVGRSSSIKPNLRIHILRDSSASEA